MVLQKIRENAKSAFMLKQRFLPKQAYSISDAVKYISLNYDINISERDVISYIQTGELKSSIHIDGNMNKIYSINKKEIDSNKKIEVRTEEIFLKFDKVETKAKINHIEDFEVFRIDLNSVYFNLKIILDDKFYLDDFFKKSDEIKLYSGELDKFKNILFSGYFPINTQTFREYNTDELIRLGGIDEFPDIVMNVESFYIHIPVVENRTGITLDDLCILHRDIIDFLELFNVIDSDDNQDEINRLRNDLELKNRQIEEFLPNEEKFKEELLIKDKKIVELQTALDDKNIPILLNTYRKDDPLKIAIEIRRKHWATYPENVKSSTQIQKFITHNYDVSHTLAIEIEKIACPIDRKKN